MNESARVPARRVMTVAERDLVCELRAEAERDFSAQFSQERFFDWSLFARRASWRLNLALQIEMHGAGWTLGWIGVRSADSEDRVFWEAAIQRLRAVLL